MRIDQSNKPDFSSFILCCCLAFVKRKTSKTTVVFTLELISKSISQTLWASFPLLQLLRSTISLFNNSFYPIVSLDISDILKATKFTEIQDSFNSEFPFAFWNFPAYKFTWVFNFVRNLSLFYNKEIVCCWKNTKKVRGGWSHKIDADAR